MKFNSTLVYLLFLFHSCIFIYSIEAETDFKETKLNILIGNNKVINVKSVGEEEFIQGKIQGNIESFNDKNLNNTELECDFIGRSYEGRGFSCGFAKIEDLQGLCYLKANNNKDVLMLSWKCSTSAGFNKDASCQGKVNLIKGYGVFSGISGFGKIDMPLATSLIKEELSKSMSINIKIKYPLSLKKL